MLAACVAAAIGCRPSTPTDAGSAQRQPAPTPSASAADQRATELTGQSVRLLDQGKLDDAIAKAAEAVETAPRLASAYEARGMAYAAKKDYPRAQADFEQVARLSPGNGRPNYRLGVLFLETRDYAQAQYHFAAAVAKGYRNPLVMVRMGDALAAGDRLAEAVEAYDRAIAADPEMAQAYVRRGKVRLRKDDPDGAKADFAKARQLNLDVDDKGNIRHSAP